MESYNSDINLNVNEVIQSSLRPARTGAEESRALQSLKKKIDRASQGRDNQVYSRLPKTQETANDIIQEVLGESNQTPIIKRGVNRNGQNYTDVYNPNTGRGVRTINGHFDTFLNLQ